MFQRRLGLHFDFHAHPHEGMPFIGESLREEDVREICREIRPDFIQIDCKGHPGWASYPTKLGNAMPLFALDPLKLWRRVTREENVKLFLHYSGVLDGQFCQKHPELSVQREDGSRSDSEARTFGFGYADGLLIPQLKELAGKYGIDGVWVDGECWAADPDYDPETVAAFEKESGMVISGKLPPEKGSAEDTAFRDYCRELFRKYVRHYTDEVHKDYPSFMITSNWMFSDHMPEPVSAKLDYLSGDFNPWNSVNSARLAGRALARQDMPWDMMSWNFRSDREGCAKGRYTKHPRQIMQEAAAVLSLGGGFQNYITQYPDASPRMDEIRGMKEVFDEARKRLPYCYGGSILPETAVFLSRTDRYLASKKLFGRDGLDGAAGLTALLCDLGLSVSVASEYDFGRGFRLIAVPETLKSLGDAPKALLDFAEKGGGLIVTGVNSIKEFIKAGLPAKVEREYAERRLFFPDGKTQASVYSSCVLSAPGAEEAYLSYGDARKEGEVFACLLPFGKGKIALVGADVGLSWDEARQAGHAIFMRRLTGRMIDPVVRLESSEGCAEVTLLVRDGKMFIQLVNMNGPHADKRVPSFDFIPPCRALTLSVALKQKPDRIVQRPCGRELPFVWDGERARFSLDRVDVHEIIEIAKQGKGA